MFYTTLDGYGTQGADGFLSESELPETTDSQYTRHCVGGNHNAKETATDE